MHRLALFAVAGSLVACSNAAPVAPDAPPGPHDDAPAAIDAQATADAPSTADAPPPPPTPALSFTGAPYSNSFDGLPTTASSASDAEQTLTGRGPFPFSSLTAAMAATGMDGWAFANPTGTGSDTEFRAQDGSQSGSAGRGVISFGKDGTTARALGTLPTSNQLPALGLLVENDTGHTLTSVTVAFTGQQWRRGTVTTPDSLAFAYGIGDTLDATGLTADSDLTFSSPNTQTTPTDVALDGTASANQKAISKTITGLSWQTGTTLVLRWTASSGSGHDDGLAIDNFLFSASE